MTPHNYAIKLEKERGHYYAYSEDFPGVYGIGTTFDEAKRSLIEAMGLYVEHCRADSKPVPAPRTVYAETVTLALD